MSEREPEVKPAAEVTAKAEPKAETKPKKKAEPKFTTVKVMAKELGEYPLGNWRKAGAKFDYELKEDRDLPRWVIDVKDISANAEVDQ